MSIFKKILALMLVGSILFCSCSSASGDAVPAVSEGVGSGGNIDVSVEPVETESKGPADFVPEGVNFDGLTVHFMVCSAYYDDNSSEIAPLEEEYLPGEMIPEAVVERNNLVYEKIGAEIESLPTERRGNWSGYQSALEKSIASGANDYDALCGAAYGAYHCAVQQLIVNLEAVDSLDLSHPWWSQRARKSFDFGTDKPIVYYINGDLNYMDNWGSSCFLFNKNFLADHGCEMPYDLVREYKWTFDAMTSMAAGMYSDLDGNGKRKVNDAFGVVANTGIMERYLPANGFDYIIATRITIWFLTRRKRLSTRRKPCTIICGTTRTSIWTTADIPRFSTGATRDSQRTICPLSGERQPKWRMTTASCLSRCGTRASRSTAAPSTKRGQPYAASPQLPIGRQSVSCSTLWERILPRR